MFTGIITDVGRIEDVADRGDRRVRVATAYDTAAIDMGASVACSGVCLTVVDKGQDSSGAGWLAFDVSGETVSRTAAAMWQAGRRLNLERALRLGDELGGHIVTGHVDGLGEVVAVVPEGGSHRVTIHAGAEIAPYVAAKGSITVDGVSLTVNSVEDVVDGVRFGLNIIPHTWGVTTFADLCEGQSVNLEIDVLARYLQRMEQVRGKA
ncbi:riboflavin synthase [Sphingomonas qomolangmaensis]|uniref:Riboflavin synthase n=1 Tax=Sphingomonas qomolangmaensis TaxID=2918765 RepID=A0ABY5L518_9SPHN|nr:riboflavin synthase [Sphingomonas qomolangmaensis]UUL82030.1 riboflavin synthase [Sphingomonas qomolangmaensis]